MELISNTPHDAFFKQFLMHPDTARDFLDIHLPAEIRGICDLDTLRLESSHFVEESLKEQYSDVLYSVKMQGTSGYIHVLIEHQSTADKKMAFRMMRYAIAVMHRLLNDANGPLPLVVPLLFYQGKTSPYPSWRGVSIVSLFRWWILPLSPTMTSCSIDGSRCWSCCKSISANGIS